MIRIVTGPPGCGKTTYCQQHKREGDIVFDIDEIAKAFGMAAKHPRMPHHVHLLMHLREWFVWYLEKHGVNCTAWVIVADESHAKRIAAQLHADIVRPTCPQKLR